MTALTPTRRPRRRPRRPGRARAHRRSGSACPWCTRSAPASACSAPCCVVGLVLVAIFLVTAAFAPLLAPYGYAQLSSRRRQLRLAAAARPPSTCWAPPSAATTCCPAPSGAPGPAFLVIVVAVVLSIFVGRRCSAWCPGYFGGWVDRVLVVDRRRALRVPVAAARHRGRHRRSAAGSRRCGAA